MSSSSPIQTSLRRIRRIPWSFIIRIVTYHLNLPTSRNQYENLIINSYSYTNLVAGTVKNLIAKKQLPTPNTISTRGEARTFPYSLMHLPALSLIPCVDEGIIYYHYYLYY